ncbi:hypothetical protein IAU59_003438 [Kwoniella sp. CBS 9459]
MSSPAEDTTPSNRRRWSMPARSQRSTSSVLHRLSLGSFRKTKWDDTTITIHDASVKKHHGPLNEYTGFDYQGTLASPTIPPGTSIYDEKRAFCEVMTENFPRQLSSMDSNLEDPSQAPQTLDEARLRYERFIEELDGKAKERGLSVKGTVRIEDWMGSEVTLTDPSDPDGLTQASQPATYDESGEGSRQGTDGFQ